MSRSVSIATTTRLAQATVVAVLVIGLGIVTLEATRTAPPQAGSADATTTTTDASETETIAPGKTITRKHETVTGAQTEDFAERTLGTAGLWILRALLVVLAAFLTGAAVQRVLLGEFALKVGGFEVPPLREATEDPSPESAEFKSAFELQIPALPDLPAQPDMLAAASSVLPEILRQVQGPDAIDYAIIDLDTGQSWLTTRLFIFAILMRRMRSLRTFVFVDSRGRIEKRYLGVVAPDALRWALARAYPWLEEAYAAAYVVTIPNHPIRSEAGALDEEAAAALVQHFISSPIVQASQAGAAGEWVQLAAARWEHASWITGALLERLVGMSLARTAIVDEGDLTRKEKARRVLGKAGPFVAIVDGNGRFLSLIDRQALLEGLADR
jgi:hypothetical protein